MHRCALVTTTATADLKAEEKLEKKDDQTALLWCYIVDRDI